MAAFRLLKRRESSGHRENARCFRVARKLGAWRDAENARPRVPVTLATIATLGDLPSREWTYAHVHAHPVRTARMIAVTRKEHTVE